MVGLRGFIYASIAIGLTACGGSGLDTYSSAGNGPDPFAISTNKPLEMPADISALPTPGGFENRADIDPVADALDALGGRMPASATPPASDAALLKQVARFGSDDAVRETLALQDEQFRKNRGRLQVLRRNKNYFAAYASMALDAYAELERFRAAGIRTPTAPPR